MKLFQNQLYLSVLNVHLQRINSNMRCLKERTDDTKNDDVIPLFLILQGLPTALKIKSKLVYTAHKDLHGHKLHYPQLLLVTQFLFLFSLLLHASAFLSSPLPLALFLHSLASSFPTIS